MIDNLTTIKTKFTKEREKMRKEIKREQESITWLNEKGAKTLRSVAVFHCKAEWVNVNKVAQVLEEIL